eukprot:scaffold2362_cov109-Cylindrotheca_fusiformis.AAC.6
MIFVAFIATDDVCNSAMFWIFVVETWIHASQLLTSDAIFFGTGCGGYTLPRIPFKASPFYHHHSHRYSESLC